MLISGGFSGALIGGFSLSSCALMVSGGGLSGGDVQVFSVHVQAVLNLGAVGSDCLVIEAELLIQLLGRGGDVCAMAVDGCCLGAVGQGGQNRG